jgi:hypothetical protein
MKAPNNSNRWLIDYSQIKIEEQVGKGAYGIVFKGYWRANKVASISHLFLKSLIIFLQSNNFKK